MNADALIGEELDAAVALAEGYMRGFTRRNRLPCWVDTSHGDAWMLVSEYLPSRAWSDGGPIMERERIVPKWEEREELEWEEREELWAGQGGIWTAGRDDEFSHANGWSQGPTLLVAVMRFHVRYRAHLSHLAYLSVLK